MATPARYLGFALVILGATGLSVGYVGWKDAASRSNPPVESAAVSTAKKPTVKKPAGRRRPARKTPATKTPTLQGSRLSPTSAVLRTTRTTRRPQPTKTPTAAPAPAPAPAQATPAKVIITAPSRKLVIMQRTMLGSGAALIAGVMLVSVSLYERPPKRPRSGADEMLNEPVPF